MAELTTAQENSVKVAVQAAYSQWLPQVEAAVLGAYGKYGVAPDPAAVATTTGAWRQQIEELEAEELADVARQQYAQEDPDGSPDLTTVLMAAAAAATLHFLLAQVGEITGQLFGIMRLVPGRSEQAAAIRAYLNPAQPHWSYKSRQLAVSEGNRWAQAASLAAAMAVARRTRGTLNKTWVTRGDEDVRHAHATTAGQRRPLLSAFNVAGFPMMHPMDPVAPPSLVVNCRCWMRFDREVPRGR